MGMSTAGIHGVERSVGDNWDCLDKRELDSIQA